MTGLLLPRLPHRTSWVTYSTSRSRIIVPLTPFCSMEGVPASLLRRDVAELGFEGAWGVNEGSEGDKGTWAGLRERRGERRCGSRPW
jgi:hypothetical protein